MFKKAEIREKAGGDYFKIDPIFSIDAAPMGHIVPCELRLGYPLGNKGCLFHCLFFRPNHGRSEQNKGKTYQGIFYDFQKRPLKGISQGHLILPYKELISFSAEMLFGNTSA